MVEIAMRKALFLSSYAFCRKLMKWIIKWNVEREKKNQKKNAPINKQQQKAVCEMKGISSHFFFALIIFLQITQKENCKGGGEIGNLRIKLMAHSTSSGAISRVYLSPFKYHFGKILGKI